MRQIGPGGKDRPRPCPTIRPKKCLLTIFSFEIVAKESSPANDHDAVKDCFEPSKSGTSRYFLKCLQIQLQKTHIRILPGGTELEMRFLDTLSLTKKKPTFSNRGNPATGRICRSWLKPQNSWITKPS